MMCLQACRCGSAQRGGSTHCQVRIRLMYGSGCCNVSGCRTNSSVNASHLAASYLAVAMAATHVSVTATHLSVAATHLSVTASLMVWREWLDKNVALVTFSRMF